MVVLTSLESWGLRVRSRACLIARIRAAWSPTSARRLKRTRLGIGRILAETAEVGSEGGCEGHRLIARITTTVTVSAVMIQSATMILAAIQLWGLP